MADSKDKIIRDLKNYMRKHGGRPSQWAVGIAIDAPERMSSGHGVNRQRGKHIHRTANSSNVARDIEDYFLDKVGTDGGAGGGDERTKQVYLYKKTKHTDP